MRNLFENLNAKLASFMIGRNGSDKLARWSLGIALVLACINIIMPNIICSVLSYALLFYCLFRMFSKNTSARESENEKFESLFDRANRTGKDRKRNGDASKVSAGKSDPKAKKTNASTVYFTCDNCGQSLSVPKGKGTLKVTCPKCKHQTTIKS